MELRIVRHTDHFDDACYFYGSVLGWPITKQWPAGDGQGRGCIFGYGDVGRVELIEHDDAVPVAGLFLGVETADVATLHDQLLAAGANILRGLAVTPWGHRALTVLDPTGLEIVCFQVMTPQ